MYLGVVCVLEYVLWGCFPQPSLYKPVILSFLVVSPYYLFFTLLLCREAGLDPTWLHSWPNQGLDGAGPSTAIRSVGLSRVQMMMRHLASVGETYAQNALEDAAWSLWPVNPSQAATSALPVPPAAAVRHPGGNGGLHMRNSSRSADDNLANVLAMAEAVREVLPHIPEEMIFQV